MDDGIILLDKEENIKSANVIAKYIFAGGEEAIGKHNLQVISSVYFNQAHSLALQRREYDLFQLTANING